MRFPMIRRRSPGGRRPLLPPPADLSPSTAQTRAIPGDPNPAKTPTRTQKRVPTTDPDHRSSRRILLATLLLRRGDDISKVAAVTAVPMALLELIRDAHGTNPIVARSDHTEATPIEPPTGSPPRGDVLADAVAESRPDHRSTTDCRRPRRARRVLAALVAIQVAAAGNIVACLIALVRHNPDLAVLTGITAAALTISVFLLTRTPTNTSTTPTGHHQDSWDPGRGPQQGNTP